MSERNDLDDYKDEFEKPKEFFKKHRVAKFVTNTLLRATVKLRYGISLSDPDMCGMLEGAVVGNPLSHPNEDGSFLTSSRAAGGRWVGYDFLRPSTFAKQKKEKDYPKIEGRLIGFMVDEVKDREPEELTPLGLLRLSDLDHLLSFNTYTVADLMDHGLLAKRTMGEAYEKVGLYGEYGEELKHRSVIDDPVFQVTPKGNTLMLLVKDSGSRRPEKEEERNYSLNPNLQPNWAR